MVLAGAETSCNATMRSFSEPWDRPGVAPMSTGWQAWGDWVHSELFFLEFAAGGDHSCTTNLEVQVLGVIHYLGALAHAYTSTSKSAHGWATRRRHADVLLVHLHQGGQRPAPTHTPAGAAQRAGWGAGHPPLSARLHSSASLMKQCPGMATCIIALLLLALQTAQCLTACVCVRVSACMCCIVHA